MSSNRAKLGAYVCGECRAQEMAPHSCSLPARLVEAGHRSSLLELATGAEGTAANYSEFARLERTWVNEMSQGEDGARAGELALPRHSEESFISLLWWMVRDAGRIRSFSTLIRAAAGIFAKLELPNLLASKRVKAVVKELEKKHGVEADPCTHATRRLIKLVDEVTLEQQCSGGILTRERVQLDLEVLGGVRVGEAAGGGDGHGALANDLSIARPLNSGPGGDEESCELWLADSKTGYGRYVNFVGRSRGIGLQAAQHVRDLWRAQGLEVKETVEDGMHVERPEYYVARISILDMDEGSYRKFRQALATCKSVCVARHANTSLYYAGLRRKAKSKGEEYMYVNIGGGSKTEAEEVAEWAKQAGLGAFVNVTPGPLLRATRGASLTHMPIVPSSTYKNLMGAIEAAYEISSKMEEPDPELDLDGRDEPKWGHHSFRRAADKVARASMKETGATREDVDEQFGWKQRERAEDMQLHYEGRTDRARRARVTMML